MSDGLRMFECVMMRMSMSLFCRKNVQGLRDSSKLEFLINAMESKGIDVALIQETWLPDNF